LPCRAGSGVARPAPGLTIPKNRAAPASCEDGSSDPSRCRLLFLPLRLQAMQEIGGALYTAGGESGLTRLGNKQVERLLLAGPGHSTTP
jgi:hypothetical protein